MDDDQQFCLRWNNHQSTLVAVFDTLLENGTLVDCTLAAEGKCLNAHKVVLSACSPYFESLLSKHFDKHPILILKDVKFQELKAMMDYMYRGEVNISQDQLGALLKAAESLQIKGLSDNRKGETERKPAPTLPPKSPQPASTIPKVQGLTIEQRSRDDSREGSMSPGPRKKKRLRRKSEELDNHDASNSSESHSLPAQNIPSSLPAVSKMNADVPEPVETKSEILTRHKQPDELPQVPIIKEKLETHTELMLEPKSEYVEEMNEDSIEDLTLDDDDLSNMEQVDDQAGPSHGNAGEGSSQGFGGWHMGNQSQDEVFLAAQEAVGAHRDSQDLQPLTEEELLNIVKIEEDIYNPPQSSVRKKIKESQKPKNKLNFVKTNFKKSPRMCVFEKERTGQMVTVYRCQSCPSFVRKNQPKCDTCSNTPHIGKKKLEKLAMSAKIKNSNRFKKNKQSIVNLDPQYNPKKKRYVENSRKICVQCGRRTRCKDAVCKICKTTELKLTVGTADNIKKNTNTAQLFKKKAIIKLQSIVVKPASENFTNKSLAKSFEDGNGRNTEQITSSKTPSIVHDDIIEDIQNLEESETREFSTIVSDLENLLSDPETQLADAINDSLFVSMNDINLVLNEN